jgi:hypothetical protein
VKDYIYEVYGWQPINPNDIRWVTKKRVRTITTSFYKGSELIGDMEQDDEGMILGSLDYRAPVERSVHWIHPFHALHRNWEDFGASL